jgi:hypothetical protein
MKHYFMLVGLWCLTPLQQYFSYNVAVSLIDGGNQSTRRIPPTCRNVTLAVYIAFYAVIYCKML